MRAALCLSRQSQSLSLSASLPVASASSISFNSAATQYLLGVRSTLEGLKLDPCVPADWKEFSVARDYLGCRINITFKNPDGKEKGISQMLADGCAIEGNILPRALAEGKKEINIEAIM